MLSGQKQKGFTIVELLIVIVVIAILAAITTAVYGQMQQRARNSAIINAASASLRLVRSYISSTGNYPISTNTSSCISSTSGCVVNTATIGANTTFDTNVATIGNLPRSIPMTGGNQTGVLYSYSTTRTYNGDAQPAIIFYWLYGTAQQCGLPDVVSGWTTGVPSTTGYTVADDTATGKTLCYIRVPGPSA